MNVVCDICGNTLCVDCKIASADFYCVKCKIAVRHPSYQIGQPETTLQDAGINTITNEPTSATTCQLL